MFTILFSIVMIFVVSFICEWLEDHTRLDTDSHFVLILLVTMFFCLFVGFKIESKIYKYSAKTQQLEVVDEMIAMSDSTSSKRSYIRAYGTEDSYVFRYVVQGRFGKQVKELKNSRSTYIIEDDRSNPSIIKYKYKLDNKILSFLVAESFFDDERRTEVIVPSGTMVEGYTIDLN